jgi:hypothetical protein
VASNFGRKLEERFSCMNVFEYASQYDCTGASALRRASDRGLAYWERKLGVGVLWTCFLHCYWCLEGWLRGFNAALLLVFEGSLEGC